jgi:hypothetical protein
MPSLEESLQKLIEERNNFEPIYRQVGDEEQSNVEPYNLYMLKHIGVIASSKEYNNVKEDNIIIKPKPKPEIVPQNTRPHGLVTRMAIWEHGQPYKNN